MKKPNKDPKTPKLYFALLIGYIVLMIVIMYLTEYLLTPRKGMGGYWWFWGIPVFVILLLIAILYRFIKTEGATKYWLNPLIGTLVGSFLSLPFIFFVTLINDFNVESSSTIEFSIIETHCTSSTTKNKTTTTCHVSLRDSSGETYRFSTEHGYAIPFSTAAHVKLEIQTGVFGGRFFNIKELEDNQFWGTR